MNCPSSQSVFLALESGQDPMEDSHLASHIQVCPSCSKAWARYQALSSAKADIPYPTDMDWSAMFSRIQAQPLEPSWAERLSFLFKGPGLAGLAAAAAAWFFLVKGPQPLETRAPIPEPSSLMAQALESDPALGDPKHPALENMRVAKEIQEPAKKPMETPKDKVSEKSPGLEPQEKEHQVLAHQPEPKAPSSQSAPVPGGSKFTGPSTAGQKPSARGASASHEKGQDKGPQAASLILRNNLIQTGSNNKVTLTLALPDSGQVRARILDPMGSPVVQLLDETVPAGDLDLSWEGQNDKGQPVASGVYFLVVETSSKTFQEKVVVVR